MQFQNIVCLLNILSPWRAKADGFFDFIREPIKQACGINISHAPGKLKSNMCTGFELEQFSKLAQTNKTTPLSDLWLATYHDMPTPALDYLFAHLPHQSLILSSEMPPWLRKACEQRQQMFLDIRQSPLGFGRDSFIALDTNSTELRSRLAKDAITEDELRLEASQLSANMRIHRRQMEESMRHTFNLDGTLIYIWQPSWDSSLIQPDGHVLHITDFSEQIKYLSASRKILFLRDFSDPHTENILTKERLALSNALEQSVQYCPQNIYQILTAYEDIELLAINAAALQEAKYFDKKSHSFSPQVTPLSEGIEHPGYLQVHFHKILAPIFWHQLLTPTLPLPRLAALPALDRQHARESMNDWGEYEKVLTWERYLPWQAYRRLGGIAQGKRIAALEMQVMALTNSSDSGPKDNIDIMSSRIRALKDTKVGQTAYILGNGPSISELNIENIMQLESFWCNNAYKMEEEGHKFSPKYYFCHDTFNIQKNIDKFIKIDAGIKFFGAESAKLFSIVDLDACKNIIEYNVSIDFNKIKDKENFSINPSTSLFAGASSVTFMMQFAFYMGYSRILIGGVDLDYSQPYFYNEFNPLKDSRGPVSEKTKSDILFLKDYLEKKGRVVGKITKSPKLPIEYIECPEILKTQK